MPKNRNRPRKRKSPKTRHGFPPAPERPSSPRGAPFPKGNELGHATRFKAGKTGNPGGVPKTVQEFRELVRQRTMTALDRLDDLLDHGSEEGVVKGIRETFAQGWPKPTIIELGGPGGGPVNIKAELTSDEKRARAAALVAKATAMAAALPPADETPADDEDDDSDDADD